MGEQILPCSPGRCQSAGKTIYSQILCAIVFLYKHVLEQAHPQIEHLVRPKPTPRVTTVLTPAEVTHVLGGLRGVPHLVASLLYGAGLRLLECCALRVQDLDLTRREITVSACSSEVMASAPSENSSATATCPPPKSTPTS